MTVLCIAVAYLFYKLKTVVIRIDKLETAPPRAEVSQKPVEPNPKPKPEIEVSKLIEEVEEIDCKKKADEEELQKLKTFMRAQDMSCKGSLEELQGKAPPAEPQT
eukprot:gene19607-26290_t